MYKEVGKAILDGTEGSWTTWYNTDDNNIGFYNYMNAEILKTPLNAESSINNMAFCNCFSESISRVNIANGVVEQYKICGFIGASYLAIGLAKDKLSDWSTRAKAIASFKTWLSNNNVIVYYVLQTPTTTEITDTYLLNQLNGILDIELYNNLCYIDIDRTPKSTMKLKYNYLKISGSQYVNVKKGAYDYTYPVTLTAGYELDEGDSITYTTEWKHNNTTITDTDLLEELDDLLNISLYNNSNVFTFSTTAKLTVAFIPTTITYEIASSDEELFTFKKGITYTVNPGDYTIYFYTRIGSSLAKITVTNNTIYFPTRDFKIYKVTVSLPTYTAISNKRQKWRLYRGTEADNTYPITLGSLVIGNGDYLHNEAGKWKLNTTEITDSTLLANLRAIERLKLYDGETNYINWHGANKITMILQYFYKEGGSE